MDLWDSILEEAQFITEAEGDDATKKDTDKKDDKTKASSNSKETKDDQTEEPDEDADTGEEEPDGGEDPAGDEADTVDAADTDADDTGDTGESTMDGEDTGEGGDADSGSMDSGSSDANASTEPTQDADKNSQVNKVVLLDNFISLYRTIDNTLKKITAARKDNILASVTFNQVRTNVEKLGNVVYNYITLYYDANDHALNLYNFKYFMEILKLNLEMVKKVGDSSEESKTSI